MCLGIPGQIVEIVDTEKQLGRVEVLGTTRTISLCLLEPEAVQIGTWVLIYAGMATSQLDVDQA
jgi:hydrogenase expression/formation protein HypC